MVMINTLKARGDQHLLREGEDRRDRRLAGLLREQQPLPPGGTLDLKLGCVASVV